MAMGDLKQKVVLYAFRATLLGLYLGTLILLNEAALWLDRHVSELIGTIIIIPPGLLWLFGVCFSVILNS